ncbi:hypothetical protein BDV98DRAFT_121805 [Pterulicium gracile]|uniref:Uncharacterized protein n=1 Tax=Pterulicium gracile TaxID=1884261 RepID=A0A5C3QG15_9AGAR|nr:hypothetical protein BDV98DRAFT_121805 [Pterula gracilis]
MHRNMNRNTAIAVVAGVVGGAVITPPLAPLVVGLVGFGPGGVVAGSTAAAIQAGIGNVVAGGAFAGAQAVGAGAAVPLVGQAIGGLLVGGGTYIARRFRGERAELTTGRD